MTLVSWLGDFVKSGGKLMKLDCPGTKSPSCASWPIDCFHLIWPIAVERTFSSLEIDLRNLEAYIHTKFLYLAWSFEKSRWPLQSSSPHPLRVQRAIQENCTRGCGYPRKAYFLISKPAFPELTLLKHCISEFPSASELYSCCNPS